MMVTLSPIILVAAFWGLLNPQTWTAPEDHALRERIALTVLTATGPLAGALFHDRAEVARSAAVCAVVWPAWLAIALATRLRHLPYWFYFVSSGIWCIMGLMVASLVIT